MTTPEDDLTQQAIEQIQQFKAGTWTPPVLNIDEMKAALDRAAAAPPFVTRFEVPPAIDQQLRALATSGIDRSRERLYAPEIPGVQWTVDPTLNARQIRTHWSDGTSKVHDL